MRSEADYERIVKRVVANVRGEFRSSCCDVRAALSMWITAQVRTHGHGMISAADAEGVHSSDGRHGPAFLATCSGLFDRPASVGADGRATYGDLFDEVLTTVTENMIEHHALHEETEMDDEDLDWHEIRERAFEFFKEDPKGYAFIRDGFGKKRLRTIVTAGERAASEGVRPV